MVCFMLVTSIRAESPKKEAPSAKQMTNAQTGTFKDSETREINRALVKKFFDDGFEANVLFGKDGSKEIPWYPPDSNGKIIWKGRAAIDKNFKNIKELFSSWVWDKIQIYGTDDPNYFWVECIGTEDVVINGVPKKITTTYINSFRFDENHKIKEFTEFSDSAGPYPYFGIKLPLIEQPPYTTGR